jgi:hypothetical protein
VRTFAAMSMCPLATVGTLVAGILGGSAALANYTYDALGRRIKFVDPVAGVTTRYTYDGANVIEERAGACPGPTCDARIRYHVNGGQYIDERIATFTATDPKLLVALWWYAAAEGVGNGRKLDRRCGEHDAYRWLCGGVGVNYLA